MDGLVAGGGTSAFERPYFDRSQAYQTWQALIRELQRYPFTSVNDQHVIEAYQQKDRIARDADRERKARDRRRTRRSGEIDDQDIALLDSARARRGVGLLNAARDANPPYQITRVPHRSLVEMMDVWLGREILRARQETPTLGKIARWIVATGRSNSSKNISALETRVSKDLGRITKFEKVPWKGSVLLPPLDRRVEFPSDVEVASAGTRTP